MRRSEISRSARPAARRRRLVSLALSLGVLALELMLLFWVLFLGAPTGGSGGKGVSGNASGLAVVAFQSSTAAHASHRAAKAKASRAPKPQFITHGPPSETQRVIAPEPGTLPEQASAETFEPLSGRRGAGDPCNLALDLATDLQTNPFAQAAVGSVPEQSLSVAGALLLWDGHWVVPAVTDPGSAMLRDIVLREVAAAKPECLAELNPGPQFLFVKDGAKTVTIVIGSGQWRWGDLATSQ